MVKPYSCFSFVCSISNRYIAVSYFYNFIKFNHFIQSFYNLIFIILSAYMYFFFIALN